MGQRRIMENRKYLEPNDNGNISNLYRIRGAGEKQGAFLAK